MNILKLTPLLLVNPNPVLEDETDDRWKWFKGCLGALDGTYIPIRVQSIYKPRYRTHVDSKIRAWRKSYAVLSLLKSRSGLGFQYSDGILVDCPKSWDELIKADPNAKKMNSKKWPLFADWEEIFGKDRATGEFTEGPEDAVEEIERTEAQEVPNDMSLGFPIIVVDEDDASATREDQAAQEEPNNWSNTKSIYYSR